MGPTGPEIRFVPAGRLTLTEAPSPNPAARELASAFAYGTRYLERPDSFELDPVSLSLTDRSAVRGQLLYPVPARNDAFDVARAETCTLELARRCGLTVPEVRHCDIGNRSVMLIRRFDRFWANPDEYPPSGPLHDTRHGDQRTKSRTPFVSGLTLVGCAEIESPDKSYGDLAHAIRRHVHPEHIARDNEELFAHMVFNIFVSNDDDHLRNRGFIRDPRVGGWQLSPLYDVVPRPGIAYERRLHLYIGAEGKVATLDNALTRFTAFLADRAAAITVILRVWGEVRQWKTVFESFGAPGLLIDQLASAFRPLEEIASPSLIKELRLRR